ncbi:EamA family transporter RarD [Clavibacter sepedonicus]|uniref:Integral membrane protein n=1 Tax=Clavibacter sepedonicus TaxID=31964 RepID=B0RD47_CLASE|nr:MULTISPECIES: EamA family transporter RarD [Clavibacter]MBD5383060.1 EamA family transporter RarD [Clavibacter sp.]OQJ49045.1 EamA family transporter [Clavibacter sepedonicus]OQJ53649.1 EamA family transporter [Clavibacter sepedonicus]UUK65138.1 EamA family transporter RarD [Clavibacter sepedonicus]CAQ00646.1 putative integral membrane protein [Clavibacter sepedonicus]
MTRPTPESSTRTGLIAAVGAYGLWGVLPVFFLLLVPAGAFEIVGWRILFSLVVCAIVITAARRWSRVVAIVRRPRIFLGLGLAGHLILVNWTVYVYGTLSGHVVETALGYFINPIVTVLLGVILLRERLRPLQWAAVCLSAVAVAVIAVGYGQLPWVSLALAGSFGLYGLVKKRVSGGADALSGLALETAWLVPAATAMLVITGAGAGLTIGTVSPGHTLLLVSTGVVTAGPLLPFGFAAGRLPLSVIGLTQYLAPLLQFAFGVFVLHEAMPPERWAGFAIVWAALVLLTIDMVRASRRPITPVVRRQMDPAVVDGI